MSLYNTIRLEDCYAEQVIAPTKQEEYKLLSSDIKFLLSCQADPAIEKWFTDLYTLLNKEDANDIVVELFKGFVEPNRVYLSIRNNDGVVIGFIRFGSSKYNAWGLDVYITEPYRGKGIVKRLLNGLIEQIVKLDIKTISATVASDNLPSIGLMQRLGFKVQHKEDKGIMYQFDFDELR